jgi:hypothetical protein
MDYKQIFYITLIYIVVGLIGEVFLSLKEISDGIPVMDIFPVKSDSGKTMGNLQVRYIYEYLFFYIYVNTLLHY